MIRASRRTPRAARARSPEARPRSETQNASGRATRCPRRAGARASSGAARTRTSAVSAASSPSARTSTPGRLFPGSVARAGSRAATTSRPPVPVQDRANARPARPGPTRRTVRFERSSAIPDTLFPTIAERFSARDCGGCSEVEAGAGPCRTSPQLARPVPATCSGLLTDPVPAATLNRSLFARVPGQRAMSNLDTRSRAILKEIIRVHVDTGQAGVLADPLQVEPVRPLARVDPQHHGGPDRRRLPRAAPHLRGPRSDGPRLPPLHRRADAAPEGRRGRAGAGRLGPGVRRAPTSRGSSRRPRGSSRSCRARSVSSWRRTRSTRSSRACASCSVRPGKVLVVQVNEPDVVISRVIETDGDYSARELEACQRAAHPGVRRPDASRGAAAAGRGAGQEKAACDRILGRRARRSPGGRSSAGRRRAALRGRDGAAPRQARVRRRRLL